MNDNETQNQVEEIEDIGRGSKAERKRWLMEIAIAGKNDKRWRERADKVIKRYRDERDASEATDTRINLLWSNTQTILPALYANTPNPMVDRRNKQKDSVGLMAARVMEGALEYAIDSFDFDDIMRCAVEDYQLPGRAVARVFYRPAFKKERLSAEPISYEQDYAPNYDDPDNPIEIQGAPIYAEGVEFDDEGPYTMEEVLDYEEVEAEYVYWKDFRMGKAKNWKSVPWVAFRSYLTKDEVEERFGEAIAEKMTFDHRNDDDDSLPEGDDAAELLMTTEIWEVWDKVAKKVIWVSSKYTDGVLDKSDPHMNFKDFFPCTKPLIMNGTTGTMIPVPEFVMYQDQAANIDELSTRIDILTKAIRVSGAYDSNAEGLSKILSSDSSENKLYPISNWAQFMDKGGLEKAVAWLPIEQMANVLNKLIEARELEIQKTYEITGIADILRGTSDANETAAAQKIKGRFASMRLADKQKVIAKFARDVIQLCGEVIAENFSKETLQAMTGIRYEKELQEQPEQQQGQIPMMPGMGAGGGMPPGMPQGMQQPGQMMPPQGMAVGGQMPGLAEGGLQMPPANDQMEDQREDQINEEMWDKVMELLRNDPLRGFRISIETDSTIQPDEQEEKQKRVEFLESAGRFMQGAVQLVAADSKLTPLVTEMLMFGIRGFRAGRELEQRFEDVMDQINKEAAQPKPQQKDPRMIEAEAKAAEKKRENDQKLQFDAQKHAQDMKQDEEKHQQDMAQAAQKAHLSVVESGTKVANQQRETFAKIQSMNNRG